MKAKRMVVILTVGMMVLGTLPLISGTIAASDARDADGNGDFATADPVLGSDVTIVSDLTGVGDPFDFFKIELNNSGGGNTEKLIVNVTANGNGAVRLNIYDPQTYWIVADLTLGKTSYLEVKPEFSGWYYVALEGQGMNFQYSIRFQKTSVPWNGDSNTDAANATVVSVFPFETTKTYDNSSDPQDFFKVNLERVPGDHTDILMVKFTPPTNPDKAVAEMYYSSNNTGISGMVNQKGASWINPPAGNIFTFAPAVTGDVLVRIWGYEGSSSYTLKMKKVVANEDTNNDEASAGSILDTGDGHTDTTTGDVAQKVDNVDYFSFSGKSGMHINATLDSVDYDADMDLPTIYLALSNSSGYELVEAELDVLKFSADPFAYIEGDLTSNETYYVQVEGINGAGNYDLDLTANTPPQVVADWLDANFEMFIWENDMNDTIDLDSVFMDFDGDAMTYTSDAGTNQNLDVSIDGATGVATYTPTSNFKGLTCANITAEDALGAKGTTELCARVYGVNHAPFIQEQFNKTYTNGVLGMKYGEVKTLHLTDYFNDMDVIDKHWYSVEGNDQIKIYFAEETPVTPDHYHTGIITVVAPSVDITESVKFFDKDNGWPSMTSLPLNLTIQVSSGEIKVLSKPGGQLNIKEDSYVLFPVNEYIYFKPPSPSDDTIEYSQDSSANLTVTITDGVANITPIADWCGVETFTFMGQGVKNDVSNTTKLKVAVACINDEPVLQSSSPTGTITVDEGGNLTFSISVSDVDTEPNMMRYQWFVDGVQQASVLDKFEYTPSFTSSGTHNISVTFNDTEFEDQFIWEGVIVNEVNRDPVNVEITEPNANASFFKGKKVPFKARKAVDPDNDPLTYTWRNGNDIISNNQTFEYKFKKKGMQTITLEVSDGNGAIVSDKVTIKIKAKKKDGPGFEGLVLVSALFVAAMVIARMRRWP